MSHPAYGPNAGRLQRALDEASSAGPTAQPAGRPANAPCAALLDRVGGDEEIFAELCDAFLDDAPRRLELIRAAVAAGDARALQREAHAFKGSAGAFDAIDVVNVARQLEQLGAMGELGEAHLLWKLLESRSRVLLDEVRAGRGRS